MSTELTTRPDAASELASLQEQGAKLAEGFQQDIGADEVALPLVKLAQALTAEVSAGKAKAGEYVNSITGRSYGAEFELIVAERFRGRFFSPKGSQRAWVAGPSDIVPNNWPEEYAGKRFSELPDAQEQYSELVNTGQIESWGSGPPISTTHNYVGFVRGELGVPVRVSLMRTSASAAKPLNTLLKLHPAPWDIAVKFTVGERTNREGQKSYVVEVAEGGPTVDDEKVAAIKCATALQSASYLLVGEGGDEPVAPAKPAKALDIE